MAKIPEPEHTTVRAIYQLHADAARPSESKYIGAGTAGHICERYLWLSLRNARHKEFDPRIRRLFETGHLEENRVLSELKRLKNIEIYTHDPDNSGRQISTVFADGHGKGYLDAIALGLPEAPKTWHVLDVKTISSKKLNVLLALMGKHKHGEALKLFEIKYWAQGMIYMGQMELTRAMFLFVCKDTDTLIAVRYEFDPVEYQKLMARAKRVAFAETPMPPISFEPDHYDCRYCNMHPICHGTAVPRPHCRTCAHVTPRSGGDWQCSRFDVVVEFTDQMRDGECPEHRYIPALLSNIAQHVENLPGVDGSVDVEYENRLHPPERTVRFINGPAPTGWTSIEIYDAGDKSLIGDDQTDVGKAISEWRQDGAVVVSNEPRPEDRAWAVPERA